MRCRSREKIGSKALCKGGAEGLGRKPQHGIFDTDDAGRQCSRKRPHPSDEDINEAQQRRKQMKRNTPRRRCLQFFYLQVMSMARQSEGEGGSREGGERGKVRRSNGVGVGIRLGAEGSGG